MELYYSKYLKYKNKYLKKSLKNKNMFGGAEQSVALATGRAATTNPYSTLLGGFGSSPAFGTAAGNALYSLFG